MPNHINHLEQRLWTAADELRANSKLRAADYSLPVLGLIFLKYADFKFERLTAQLQAAYDELPANDRRRRDPLVPDRYPPDLYDQKRDDLYRHSYECYADRDLWGSRGGGLHISSTIACTCAASGCR